MNDGDDEEEEKEEEEDDDEGEDKNLGWCLRIGEILLAKWWWWCLCGFLNLFVG